jgi:uncharacterized protein YndB with AHSA1/START domain
MKILKNALLSLVGLVLLCVIALLALGGWRGTTSLQSEIVIAKPPAEVYPWISEADRLPKWVSWLVEVKELTPGVTGVGRKEVWRMDDPNMGQIVEVVGETVAAEAPKLRRARVTMDGGFEGEVVYELVDLGGSTRLRYSGRYAFDSWFASLLSPIVTYQAQQKLDSDVAMLKKMAESSN